MAVIKEHKCYGIPDGVTIKRERYAEVDCWMLEIQLLFKGRASAMNIGYCPYCGRRLERTRIKNPAQIARERNEKWNIKTEGE